MRSAFKVLATGVMVVLLGISCSGSPSYEPALNGYEIEGVGIGSDCNFSGEFEKTADCAQFVGRSPSPYAVTLLLWTTVDTGSVIGVASSKSIASIEGDAVEAMQADGTIAMFRIAWKGSTEQTIVVNANDGTFSTCEAILRGANVGAKFLCSPWAT